MTYEYQAWPAWRYGPKGESAIFESEKDVPKGWSDQPKKGGEKAVSEKDLSDPHNVPSLPENKLAEAALPPSIAPVAAEGKEELAGLREHYKKVVGKKPYGGWNADTIRAKLDEFESK